MRKPLVNHPLLDEIIESVKSMMFDNNESKEEIDAMEEALLTIWNFGFIHGMELGKLLKEKELNGDLEMPARETIN